MFFDSRDSEVGGRVKLVVGLGNPGIEYQFTPHNIGFLVVDRLAERHDAHITNRRCKALTGKCRIGEHEVLLAKPETFMNASGMSVRELVEEYEAAARVTAVLARVAADGASIPASDSERCARHMIAAVAGSGIWMPFDYIGDGKTDACLTATNAIIASDPIVREGASTSRMVSSISMPRGPSLSRSPFLGKPEIGFAT